LPATPGGQVGGGFIRTSLEGAIQERTTPFTNHLNVRIDPTKPAVYLGPENAPMVFGGDYASRLAEAEAYAHAHKGVDVYVEAEPYVGADGVPHSWVYSLKYTGWTLIGDPFERHRPEIVDAAHPPPADALDKFINPENLSAQVTAPTVVT
jgi:hypothetical protein